MNKYLTIDLQNMCLFICAYFLCPEVCLDVITTTPAFFFFSVVFARNTFPHICNLPISLYFKSVSYRECVVWSWCFYYLVLIISVFYLTHSDQRLANYDLWGKPGFPMGFVLFTVFFMLQWLSRVVAPKKIWSRKLKIFIVCPFYKKFC